MADWEIVDDNASDWEIIPDLKVSKEEPKRTGFKGVGQDIMSGVAGVPGALRDLATSLPGEVYGGLKQTFTDPVRVGQNVLGGLAEGGHGLLNAPYNTANYLASRDLFPKDVAANFPRQEDYNFPEMLGREGSQSGDALISGLASFAPNMITGSTPAAMALHAVGQNQNPVTAALIPGATKNVVKGITSVAKTPLTPSGWVADFTKDQISLSELADNLRAAEGTETPLGDVVKSPRLKKLYENKLAEKAPWEVEQTYKRINEQVQARAEDLIDKTLGENAPPGDTNIFIKDLLSKAYEDSTTVKNNLYTDVSKRAIAEDFRLKLPKFNSVVDNNLKAIAESPMFLADAESLSAFKDLLDLGGKKPTISAAKYFASKFESEAKALKNPDATSRSLKSLYQRTANALRSDVREQIAEKGSDALKKEFNIAEDFYKDDFVQFLDNDLYKLLDEGKDAQTIVKSIINPSKKLDKYTLIEKTQKLFPKEQKNILGYSYLKSAIDNDGVLQPTQVNNLIKSLGPRQFNALFPDPKIRQSVSDFSKLRNMNAEAAGYLLNLKNGSRNQGWLKDMMQFIPEALGGTAASGGGTLGMLLGIGLTHGLKTASNKYLAKLLTDPDFRNKVATKIKDAKKGDK